MAWILAVSRLPCSRLLTNSATVLSADFRVHPVMNKIGLALSGGGFRATLYHLGLVRFLRDAGILSRVTHITSVSGGSVIAAHLVLNWQHLVR